MKSADKQFILTPLAIIKGKRTRLDAESYSGDIVTISRTLEWWYGLYLTEQQIRYRAKKRKIMKSEKNYSPSFGTRKTTGISMFTPKEHELQVEISELGEN